MLKAPLSFSARIPRPASPAGRLFHSPFEYAIPVIIKHLITQLVYAIQIDAVKAQRRVLVRQPSEQCRCIVPVAGKIKVQRPVVNLECLTKCGVDLIVGENSRIGQDKFLFRRLDRVRVKGKKGQILSLNREKEGFWAGELDGRLLSA